MESRVNLGAIIALVTLVILGLGVHVTPWLVVTVIAFTIVLIYAEIKSWFSWRNNSPRDKSVSTLLLGSFTLAFLTAGAIALSVLAIGNMRFVIGVFVIAYGSDTAAILVGRGCSDCPVIGRSKRPIFKFAPSKTLAGFLGAALFGLFCTLALGSIGLLPARPLTLLSPLIVIAADLLGSGYKRRFGIKDSGEIMAQYHQNDSGREAWFSRLWRGMLPHGGFLDRFGSVLLLALFIYLIANWGAFF